MLHPFVALLQRQHETTTLGTQPGIMFPVRLLACSTPILSWWPLACFFTMSAEDTNSGSMRVSLDPKSRWMLAVGRVPGAARAGAECGQPPAELRPAEQHRGGRCGWAGVRGGGGWGGLGGWSWGRGWNVGRSKRITADGG